MKKLIALLLVLACAFALVACGGEPTPDPEPECEHVDADENGKCDKCGKDMGNPNPGPKPDEKPDVTPFKNAVAATNPTKATITTAYDAGIGTLNGTYEITYNNDGSATIAYSYEVFNEISLEVTEPKSTVSGTVTRNADGSYTDGGIFAGNDTSAVSVKIDVEKINIDDVSIEGKILTVVVKAADTAKVLGVAFDSDVTVVLTIGETAVASLNLSYNDQKNTITCVYQ